MALLRKDIKIGFLAGGALLALGTGYVLVLGLTGSSAETDEAAFDPLGDPIASVMSDPAGTQVAQANGPVSLSATTTTTTESLDDGFNDAWGDLGEPVVTRTPTTFGQIEQFDETYEAAPAVANLNQPEYSEFGNFPSANSTAQPFAEPEPSAPAAPDLAAGARTHVVRAGDNVSSIADEYFGDANLFQAILDANPGLDPRRMKIGQELLIPSLDAAQQVAETPAVASGGTHTVAAGDTLSKIAARRLGRSALWESIYELNRDLIGEDPAALKVGMVLRLPQ